MTLRGRWGTCGIVVLTLAVAGIGSRGAAAGGDDAPAAAAARTGSFAALRDTDSHSKWFAIFSPDGKTLVEGGEAATLKFWEVGTWRELRTIQAPSDSLRCAAFSRDGKLLAVGGRSGTLTLWDTASNKIFRDFHEHQHVLRTINFSPDGQLMVTSGQDRKVAVWETATWRVVRTLSDLPLPALSSRVSPDGQLLAVVLGNAEPPRIDAAPAVRLYDLATLTQRFELTGVDRTVLDVAFSPDSKTVAAVGIQVIRLWNSKSGEPIAAIDEQYIFRVAAFSPDGKSLLTAGGDLNVPGVRQSGLGLIWDLAARRPKATLRTQGTGIEAASFSPDGKLLATTTSNAREVRVWEVATLPEPSATVIEAALNRDSGLSPVGNAGSGPYVVRPSSAFQPPSAAVTLALAYSPDGRLLAQAGEDKTILLRDAATDEVIKTLTGHTDVVNGLAFAPDGRTLASASYDKTVRLWDIATGGEKATLSGHSNWVLAVAFAPDGKTLASASYDKLVKLWDVANAKERASLAKHTASVRAVAFAPDGKTVASAGSDRVVQLWDVASRSVRITLKGHKKNIRALAFSPDGTTLASASEDNTIKLWDVSAGKERATLEGHEDMVTCLAFGTKGATLLSGAYDGVIKLWDLSGPRGTGHVCAAHAESITASSGWPQREATRHGPAWTSGSRSGPPPPPSPPPPSPPPVVPPSLRSRRPWFPSSSGPACLSPTHATVRSSPSAAGVVWSRSSRAPHTRRRPSSMSRPTG